MKRKSAAAIFVLYGFLKSFKPSEAFLSQFLIQVKGLTREQVDNDIYPLWNYCFLLLILPITYVAERFGYRVAILLESVGHFATRFILIFGQGLLWMQMTQFTFALAIAGEIAYYSYVFKCFSTDVEFSRRVTVWSHAAVLVGHCFASILGQVLVLNNVPYLTLFYISAATVGTACLLSLFFPSANDLIAGENAAKAPLLGSEDVDDDTEDEDEDAKVEDDMSRTTQVLADNTWKSILTLAAVPFILVYALNKAHVYNIEGFSSVLWYKLLQDFGWEHRREKILNGFIDAGSRGLAAIMCLFASRYAARKDVSSVTLSWIVSAGLLVATVLTFAETMCTNVFASYTIYVFLVGISVCTLTLASINLAEQQTLQRPYYASLFGLATFMSGVATSLIQFIMKLIDVDIVFKFWAFSGFATSISLLAFTHSLWINSKRTKSETIQVV